jgi:sensor histidine kinase YesM
MLVLFGGIFLVFSREQISIWNPMYAANTVILGSSMMMYFVTAYAIITSFLKGFVKKIATVVTAVVGAGSVMAMLLSVITSLDFYDTYVFWTVLSVSAASVIAVCMIINVSRSSKDGWDKTNLVFIPAGALIVAFILDVIFALFGIWQNGAMSIAVLFAIVIASSVVIGRVVPKSISAILEAKNIEAERQAMELKLQESRISIMLSQIQPHFLYNTLNSIYHLCETNPMLARSLVNSFSEYLRNNLSSLEQTGLVPFETELSHVKTYLDIEKVRFEDTLEIEYDIKCVDFALPVLTVQPIVENAVKHGTSKKRGGGRVVVATFEEREFYVIRVTDTGCGFDPEKPKNDGKRHIGIENARQRLSNMCQGSLTIESEIGVGTVATIRIPKGDEK